MASLTDCALLANAVYSRSDDGGAGDAGWQLIDAQCWMRGFAAGQYTRQSGGGSIVVAYRGTETDDAHDLIADAAMFPALRTGAGQQALAELFRQYGVSNTALGMLAPIIIGGLLDKPTVALTIRVAANRVPDTQGRQALQYFDRCSPRPELVVGHSLGGALAKYVSEQRRVPVVAFNSPHMGDLRRSVPATSRQILNVNAVGDPLSLATRAAGGLSHGRDISIAIPPFRSPPRIERRPLHPVTMLAPALGLAAREAEARARYYSDLVSYIVDAMLYYHTMANLLAAIRAIGRFHLELGPDVSAFGG